MLKIYTLLFRKQLLLEISNAFYFQGKQHPLNTDAFLSMSHLPL